MEIKLSNAANIVKKNTAYLLYGNPGMGKTTTVKFLPGKTLLLDIDKTSHVLKGCDHIDILDIPLKDTFDYWVKLMDEMPKIVKNYDNIVIDNISELERCLLSDLGAKGKNKGTPAMGDYQHVQFLLPHSLRYLKNLNKTIILLAWEYPQRISDVDGNEYTQIMPQLQSKTVNVVCGLCDVVGRLMIKDTTRFYLLESKANVYAKNQLDDRKYAKQDEIISASGKTD